MKAPPRSGAPDPLLARFQPGLDQLREAHAYATAAGRDPWEFAVELASLRAAGLTTSDLRWLVCQGHVAHARERTRLADERRSFRPASSLAFGKRSCFVLTPKGLELARHQGEPRPQASAQLRTSSAQRQCEQDVPFWDASTHTLYWRGEPVKHFRADAPHQEAILDSFQESGWPRCLSVSLPRDDEISPKERLHDTVKNLNRNVRPYLRFAQEGSGGRVIWEEVGGNSGATPS